jgi:phage terminase large subunit-like protein
VIAFIQKFCLVPEGALVGKPVKLADFQKQFIRDIYDNPAGTRRAYLGIARKNGKSALIACLLLAHLAGPEAKQNSQIVSGARSRDQASLVFNLAAKMISLSPELSARVRIIPSGKRLVGLSRNVEYRALAADGTTAHGLSPVLAILDEVGQVRGPQDDFIDAITTAFGAHSDPLLIAISTSAPSDGDLFSIWQDDATRSGDPRIVSRVYAAATDADLEDPEAWKAANPALGIFRSLEDVAEQAKQAKRMPTNEASFRNLILNQRISTQSLFIAPEVWKSCGRPIDRDAFYQYPVHLGLDLSKTDDLCAIVASVRDDDGFVHLLPWVLSPEATLETRAARDRAPYPTWVKNGQMFTLPGRVLDYRMAAEFLKAETEGMRIASIQFDRWRAEEFKREAEAVGFAIDAEYVPVGQGFKDQAPRLEKFNELLLNGRLRHGNHPVLTSGAANAIVVRDSAFNGKLEKAKSTQKIDQIVASVMSAYASASLEAAGLDIEALIA